jgi:hypothetical protein
MSVGLTFFFAYLVNTIRKKLVVLLAEAEILEIFFCHESSIHPALEVSCRKRSALEVICALAPQALQVLFHVFLTF